MNLCVAFGFGPTALGRVAKSGSGKVFFAKAGPSAAASHSFYGLGKPAGASGGAISVSVLGGFGMLVLSQRLRRRA